MTRRILLIRLLYPLLAFVAYSQQVDITLIGYFGTSLIKVECPKIAPGTCCRTPNRYGGPLGYSHVSFRDLHDQDLASIWVPYLPDVDEDAGFFGPNWRDWRVGCSGRITASKLGPGTWSRQMRADGRGIDELAVGASYTLLPRSMPPDPDINLWLEQQGILGFAWEGSEWPISSAAQELIAGGSSLPGRKVRRVSRSSLKGDVYITSPRRQVYPIRMTINSTVYTSIEGTDHFMYLERDTGNTLNLTDWFI